MNYVKLKTKPIDFSGKRTKITKQQITRELMWIHKNYAFSVFSYCGRRGEGTSKKLVEKTGTGNCIGLSYGLQARLKKKYGVESYVIPATVPDYINKPEYLDISHVALMIPGSKNSVFYIADPAFYFVEPIKVDLKKWKFPGSFVMSDIYNESSGDNRERCESSVHFLESDYELNNYQTIGKNTVVVSCLKGMESWKYFVTQIVNPDAAITKFFMEVWKNKPFITRTKVEKNQVINKISIHHRTNSTITIKERNSIIYEGSVEDLTKKQLRYLDAKLSITNFRGPKFEKFLLKPQKAGNLGCIFTI
tara:strand:+ start:1422 stop:2339 length:918 start_codon:yes stop_codon:yes gene_type:complete